MAALSEKELGATHAINCKQTNSVEAIRDITGGGVNYYLAFFRARRGQSEALGAALGALVEPTRLGAGCLNYDLHRSVNDANVWFVYENWRSPEGCDPPFQVRLIGFLGGNAAPCIVVGEFTLSEVTAQLRYGHWKRTSLQRIGANLSQQSRNCVAGRIRIRVLTE